MGRTEEFRTFAARRPHRHRRSSGTPGDGFAARRGVPRFCSALSCVSPRSFVVRARAGIPVTHSPLVRSRRDRARARRASTLGWCTSCGALVQVHGFRCRVAYREFFRSGLCQDCTDRTLLSRDPASGVSYALLRGLVVGAQPSTGAVAALPFICTGPGRPIAWESAPLCSCRT